MNDPRPPAESIAFTVNGAPVAVREPASTQLLLPTPSTPDSGAASKPCVNAASFCGVRPIERYSAA